MQQKAILLLSGGLDSTTCLALMTSLNLNCYVISFDYNQKQKIELQLAQKNAKKYHIKDHIIIDVKSLGHLGGSALTDQNIMVPKFSGSSEIPVTYVPARNTIFLSYALAYAEVIKASYIYIGANVLDYSGYPDCRPEFFLAYQNLINTASKYVLDGNSLTIKTPLLHLTKAEIIKLGTSLGVDYSQTISCYNANDAGLACGVCDSCTYRKKGFSDANILDPTLYIN